MEQAVTLDDVKLNDILDWTITCGTRSYRLLANESIRSRKLRICSLLAGVLGV
jgi:hypothetical protein